MLPESGKQKGMRGFSTSKKTRLLAYQVTSATCVVFDTSTNVEYNGDSIHVFDLEIPGFATLILGAEAFDIEITLEDANSFIFDDGGVLPIYAYRAESLPESCADGIEDADNAEVMFEVFWHMFAENYAFFDLQGIDWQAVYDTYRPQITEETTLKELHNIIVEILEPFTDAHLNYLSTYGFHTGAIYPEWTNNDDEDTLIRYIELINDNYLIDTPKIVANNKIIYGRLAENIGYINILSMHNYSEDGDNIAVLEAVMPDIINEFADMDSIVVDVRFNGGGEDINSMYIAGYFTDNSHVAFAKQTWTGETFTDLQDVFVEPNGEEQFLGSVYLLPSRITTSGAEVFTMTMATLPHVTTVGEPTAGALSDILFLIFPNGWFATLSNEQYLSHDGELYEGVGIPVDVEVSMSLEALEQNIDPILDTVLNLIVEN